MNSELVNANDLLYRLTTTPNHIYYKPERPPIKAASSWGLRAAHPWARANLVLIIFIFVFASNAYEKCWKGPVREVPLHYTLVLN